MSTKTEAVAPTLIFGRNQFWDGEPVKQGDRVPLESWRELTKGQRQGLISAGYVEWFPEGPSND